MRSSWLKSTLVSDIFSMPIDTAVIVAERLGWAEHARCLREPGVPLALGCLIVTNDGPWTEPVWRESGAVALAAGPDAGLLAAKLHA